MGAPRAGEELERKRVLERVKMIPLVMCIAGVGWDIECV
jgi:hypothetical protein